MKKIRLTVLLLLASVLFIESCEGLLNDESVELGSYMFWSNFDGPPIDIFIESKMYGSITSFYTESPGCNAAGCVTVDLEPGTYDFLAIEQTNLGNNPREWDGTFTISPNICGKLGLKP